MGVAGLDDLEIIAVFATSDVYERISTVIGCIAVCVGDKLHLHLQVYGRGCAMAHGKGGAMRLACALNGGRLADGDDVLFCGRLPYDRVVYRLLWILTR